MNNEMTVPSFVLVDDDEDDRLLMRMALAETNSQFPVQEFTNGAELIDYLESDIKNHADNQIHWLIIMDINMPIMSGPDALRKLQQHPLWRRIPVMMMSTSDDPQLVQQLIDLGAKSYVVKPKSYSGLVNSIKTTFEPWLQQQINQLK
ncbi:response regulator [Fibrella sp. HMF5335]|uniref:Response regulator n=1 Tax=Fibrella rubiginis TaxID=2817060 RepID=A0A939K774_9BACT|nr:response regulator [Fibrella rubiginis]MBO0939638.1 response regulator [Fibrella rubiginis]